MTLIAPPMPLPDVAPPIAKPSETIHELSFACTEAALVAELVFVLV